MGSYPQGPALMCMFTTGVAIAGVFAVLYGCMAGGVFDGNTGGRAIAWHAVGISGLFHTFAFIFVWSTSWCGLISYGRTSIIVTGLAWVLIGVSLTAYGAAGNDPVSWFLFYCGATTMVNIGSMLAIVGALLIWASR